MALIKFYIEDGFAEAFDIDLAGSGLGFFGAGGFGRSVAVGEYQDNTFATDANGAVAGQQANNVKYRHANSGEIEGAQVLNLLNIANYHATVNIRFTHTSAVQVQNVEMCIYDRVNFGSGGVGVVTQLAELIHPSIVESGNLGSGDTAWQTAEGTGNMMELAQSPGTSGLYAGNGISSVQTDTRHDWYLAMSASPSSIGSKDDYGLFFSLEYL